MTSRSRFKILFMFSLIAGLTLIVSGCPSVMEKPEKETPLLRIPSFSFPAFEDDLNYAGMLHGISKSLAYLQRLPADRQFHFGQDAYDTRHMIRSLEFFRDYIQTDPSRRDLRRFIGKHYRIYRSIGRDGRGEVLFTGYYEPHLLGRVAPDDEYRYPIYGRPDDLISINLSLFSQKYEGERIIGRFSDDTVVPYYDRRQIESEGRLKGTARVLAWLKDPVDIFFLHIQGSGKVYLDSGEVINVHYDTSNGRPYRSIGKLLIDEEKISLEQMSMQKIRAYLQEHPDEIEPVLNYNPSYIFFKIESEGPLGFLDVKLTPGRSIALDRRIFPPAALAFIETEKPLLEGTAEISAWRKFARFALNQDTGGAIRGPGRADLFWGSGPYAEIAAGHMKHPGRLYLLVLQDDQIQP